MSQDYYRYLPPIRIDPVIEAANQQAARDWQLAAQQELASLEHEVYRFDVEIGQIESRIRLLERRKTAAGRLPVHLPLAVLALVNLMFGGVVLPLYFLGADSDLAQNNGKWVVMVWFLIGILIVFAYLSRLLIGSDSTRARGSNVSFDAQANNDQATEARSGQRRATP